MIWPRSLRDAAALVVTAIAALADHTVCAFANLTGGDDD